MVPVPTSEGALLSAPRSATPFTTVPPPLKENRTQNLLDMLTWIKSLQDESTDPVACMHTEFKHTVIIFSIASNLQFLQLFRKIEYMHHTQMTKKKKKKTKSSACIVIHSISASATCSNTKYINRVAKPYRLHESDPRARTGHWDDNNTQD